MGRCIESILNQTFQNKEIIIINDGSTDDSDLVIQKYVSKYQNIDYIYLKENIGVGNARNIGIEKTNTKYITFVDSDDWIDVDYYAKMINNMEQNNTCISISGIKTEVDDVYNWKYRYQYPPNLVADGDFCIHALTNQYNQSIRISPIVNNRIYKTQLLLDNNIQFDKSRKAQDLFFSFIIFLYADKVSFCDNTFYHYYQRNFSATHNFTYKYVDDYFYILEFLKDELMTRGLYKFYKNEYESYVNHYMIKLINNMFNNIQSLETQREFIIYIIKKASNIVPFNKLIEYVDMERLKKLFCIF